MQASKRGSTRISSRSRLRLRISRYLAGMLSRPLSSIACSKLPRNMGSHRFFMVVYTISSHLIPLCRNNSEPCWPCQEKYADKILGQYSAFNRWPDKCGKAGFGLTTHPKAGRCETVFFGCG